jgi:hypothetical protein
MSTENRDRELLERVRATLDASADNLDAATLRRLRRSRLEAVEAAGPKRRPFPLPRWVTAGGVATVAVLGVAASVWLSAPRPVLPEKQVEDLEIVTAKEQLDLYADLEFYRWLAEK